MESNQLTNEPTETKEELIQEEPTPNDSDQPAHDDKGEEEQTLTIELVQEYLGTKEGNMTIQSKLDKHFNSSLETWKGNNLPKILAEHDRKLADPNEQQLEALKQEFEFNKHQEAVIYALRSRKMIPPSFASALNHTSTWEARKKLEVINEHIKRLVPIMVKKSVGERYKGLGER